MQVIELNLPARYAAGTHFRTCYGAAHYAADNLGRLIDAEGRIKPETSREDTRRLVTLLTESLCAARALDNLLAGNPPPRRGE